MPGEKLDLKESGGGGGRGRWRSREGGGGGVGKGEEEEQGREEGVQIKPCLMRKVCAY